LNVRQGLSLFRITGLPEGRLKKVELLLHLFFYPHPVFLESRKCCKIAEVFQA